jgi:hypothetical protein
MSICIQYKIKYMNYKNNLLNMNICQHWGNIMMYIYIVIEQGRFIHRESADSTTEVPELKYPLRIDNGSGCILSKR